jgi:rhodanese-related sulfurtransferase
MTAPASRVDELLEAARRRLPHRPTADELPAVRARGALIVDIRPLELRSGDGALPGAVVIDRNVLEWRLDPTSPHRIPEATRADREIVLVCDEGYASSLAAATLRDLGLTRATDLAGGFQAVLRQGTRPAAADPFATASAGTSSRSGSVPTRTRGRRAARRAPGAGGRSDRWE